MEKLTYSIEEARLAIGIGKNAMYALVHQQGFPAVRIGKRIVIPVDSLREWLNRQGTEQQNA